MNPAQLAGCNCTNIFLLPLPTLLGPTEVTKSSLTIAGAAFALHFHWHCLPLPPLAFLLINIIVQTETAMRYPAQLLHIHLGIALERGWSSESRSPESLVLFPEVLKSGE